MVHWAVTLLSDFVGILFSTLTILFLYRYFILAMSSTLIVPYMKLLIFMSSLILIQMWETSMKIPFKKPRVHLSSFIEIAESVLHAGLTSN